MKPRKPPTLNAADLRAIKNLLLGMERQQTTLNRRQAAIEKRLARLEKMCKPLNPVLQFPGNQATPIDVNRFLEMMHEKRGLF